MNIVSNDDIFDKGICQNPELASSFEKTCPPASCPSVCSTDGKMCRSLCTLSFSFVRSTHIQTFPSALGTTTIGAHHSVGSSTREMTPCCSILSSSSLTLGNIGSATRRGVVCENGTAPLHSWMWYSPCIVPNLGKCPDTFPECCSF